jgi:hypothetical protein
MTPRMYTRCVRASCVGDVNDIRSVTAVHYRLGEVRPEAPFATRETLYPDGLQTSWTDAASGCVFLSTISAAPGADPPQPLFAVSVKRPRANPFDRVAGKVPVAQCQQDPDSVWREVVALQKVALELPKAGNTGSVEGAAAASDAVVAGGTDEQRRAALQANAPLRAALQAATLPAIRWGAFMFGLADVRALQLMEALPGVAQAEQYTYAQVRSRCAANCCSTAPHTFAPAQPMATTHTFTRCCQL